MKTETWNTNAITTAPEARRIFWDSAPAEIREHHRKSRKHNDYPVDVRMAFVDWVDWASREGVITERLAQRLTLG